MSQKEEVRTNGAPAPLPFYSQAVKVNGMVYVSGSLGFEPSTMKFAEGTVAERTVNTTQLESNYEEC